MKRLKYLLLFLLLTFSLLGETIQKEIGFGDKLTLKVKNLDEKNLREQLKDFYIEDLKDNGREIQVSFRGMTTGKKIVLLGDKELEIQVKSNLGEDEKEIYLDLSDLSNRKLFLPNFPWLFLGGVLLLFPGIYLIFKKEKKEIVLTPEERFQKRMENITDEDWSFQISYALREYIDSCCSSNFLRGNYIPVGDLDQDDIIFISSLDTLKFSVKNSNVISQNRDSALKRAWEIGNKLKREVREDV